MGDLLPIVPGESIQVQVMKVASDMAVVKILKADHQPLVAVQVGQIQAVDGQEVPVARIYHDALKEGLTATLTWIDGTGKDGLPHVLLSTRHSSSPDIIAIQEGLAIPSGVITCDAVRGKYRSALQEAAHLNRGAWSDQDQDGDLAQMAISSVGLKEGQLAASFFYANHGFSMVFLLVTVGVLLYSMKSVHEELKQDTAGDGPIKKALRYSWGSSMFQFRTFTINRRRKGNDSRPEATKEEA